MKKVLLTIFSCSLVGLLFIVAPSQTNVFAQSPEYSTPATQTKTIDYSKIYGINDPIEKSIKYEVAGWSGTLYLVRTQSTGDHILAHYRGTVHCSGFCGISSRVEVDEQK